MNLDRKTIKKIIFILCSAVLFWAVLINIPTLWSGIKWLLGILMPIILGFAIAFILTPLAASIEKPLLAGSKRLRISGLRERPARLLSVTLAYLLICGVLALIIVIIVPQIKSAFYLIAQNVQNLPAIANNTIYWINTTAAKLGFDLELMPNNDRIDWQKVSESLQRLFSIDLFAGDFFTGVIGVASSFFGAVFDLFMGLLIGFRLIVHREKVGRFFRRFLRAYFSEKRAAGIVELTSLCTGAFRSFMTGQLKEAMTLGILCWIGMTIFGFPYAIAASAIIGSCALVPVFGAWIGGIVGTLLALSDSPLRALLFIVYIVVLQILDNTFVYPKIVGNSMKLNGLLVVCAVTVGGSIAGVAGMILSVPFVSVTYTLINRTVDRRLDRRENSKK